VETIARQAVLPVPSHRAISWPESPAPGAITRDVVVSMSAIAAAWVAILGVNTWRRQLKGTTEYQIALKVLKALYAVRESMIELRSRFTFPSEWLQQPPVTQGPEEFRALAAAQSYQRRLVRVGYARADLLLAQQEALAVWSDPAKEALEDLLSAINELFVTYDLYFDEEIEHARRRDVEGREEERGAEQLAMNRVLYSKPGTNGKDPFGEKIARAVGKAEEFYRARLK
jgi:hypothetical protein